jgi:hypothetical protein
MFAERDGGVSPPKRNWGGTPAATGLIHSFGPNSDYGLLLQKQLTFDDKPDHVLHPVASGL